MLTWYLFVFGKGNQCRINKQINNLCRKSNWVVKFLYNRVHTGHEKPEEPEKQVTFVKSLEKSHENFKKLTKVMKVVIKKKKSTVSAVF